MLGGVAVIETMTFGLIDGAREDAFLAVDKRVQSDFAYRQPGLIRRTTGRRSGDGDGGWIVLDLWHSAEDADRAASRWDDDPTAKEFMSFVDVSSVEVRRYTDLD